MKGAIREGRDGRGGRASEKMRRINVRKVEYDTD